MGTGAASPARICIARHGETDWNSVGILQGWLDVTLNDAGRAQARELAGALAGAGLRAVVTSPLLRAHETAAIVAQCLRLPPPAVCDGLKERHFGALQGVPKAELAVTHPLLYQQIGARNPAVAFAGGESMDEFADRVLDTLAAIATGSAGAGVLVVTHGWVMDVVARHVHGLPRGAVLRRKPKNIEQLWFDATADPFRACALGAGATLPGGGGG